MDDPIPEIDRQRLEDMVQAYRHSIYNLYRLAHCQGEIDTAKQAVEQMKGAA